MSYCLIVPHYNHERQFIAFLPKLLATGLPCVIVDDGSSEESFARVKDFVADKNNVYLYRHRVNRGKGTSVRTALCHAQSLGFSHAVQIDADGQHCVEDIPSFVAISKEKPEAMICGKPYFDESVPKERLYGRRVTDFWVALETLSYKIKDGLCGFRVYPIKETDMVFDRYYIGPRMDFDTEILVKAVWSDIDLVFVDTYVQYPEESVSHFNYIRDNLVLIKLHTRLMVGMVLRLPMLISRIISRVFSSL